MKILKINTDFLGDLTIDNTTITIDNPFITIDTISIDEYQYHIKFVPRKYATMVTAKIRECEQFTNDIQTLTGLTAFEHKGILTVNLSTFQPIPEATYEMTFYDGDDVIWMGQVKYTTKDIQNYSVDNSDENNLRY